ncbi:acyl-CoA reductase [Novosphingobium malaysiense]|uniref:Long-chain-fatty-acyl-CoA reductase n=1 Tax=Novosphingobium malaysiense TaxID=1348853 RepID=A0A0B1ZKD1_9SPHN|nr:acyl-CoA reductase [Novosphingobium malaysiense]KHK89794.1 long-chain-fatty-acyl-CoA reductase [Novosphingobium malaysiense]
MADDTQFRVPLIIRGTVIEDADVDNGGRGGAISFTSPDVRRHLGKLVLPEPGAMEDLYRLSMDEILDFLQELGGRLTLGNNPWVEQAFEISCRTSGLSEPILRQMYATMGAGLRRESLREVAQNAIGIDYLEGWVERPLEDGLISRTRAFGARCVHIVAGNAPGTSVLTIARNAITRGDAIIKTPSNDPLTAAAVARTMIDMAPDHPLTRHLSVAYWKGGDAELEEQIYRPRNIEKIVAWGGMASIKHISGYIQPGIELVALDPKLSSTIIGKEAFADDATMQAVAGSLAMDGGGMNQEACSNARVVWVQSGTDGEGLERLNRLGAMVYDAIQALPEGMSGPAVRLDPRLQEELEAIQFGSEDWYKVIGGGAEGAVIVSQMDEPVDFAPILANRVLNLVPVDDIETPVRAVTSYTQTIGIYPESLKHALRDRLAIYGAQRIVTLGHALAMPGHGLQDAIEPWRRMCRWIVEEEAVENA